MCGTRKAANIASSKNCEQLTGSLVNFFYENVLSEILTSGAFCVTSPSTPKQHKFMQLERKKKSNTKFQNLGGIFSPAASANISLLLLSS